ncbi:MAG TPA: HPP family protein [Acetobacteraceae bacterium]|nr:HPP family protein [Acetobacteraceae bacterium]
MRRQLRLMAFRGRQARRPLRRYAGKFTGTTTLAPARPNLSHVLASWAGALFAIGALGLLAEATHAPLMLASFGASCVLLFGYPESHLSQPRNTIGGHLIAAAVGLGAVALMGDHWTAMAVAVATAIALMKLTGTVHPPAGSTAIIAVHLHPEWSFLVLPVLSGAALLVVLAAMYNNVIEHRRYPLYWW